MALKKKPVTNNKKELANKKKEMYKNKEKLISNTPNKNDSVILYKEGMTVNELADRLNVSGAELVKKLEEKGHEVVDTIFAEETPEGDARLYYLAKSIEAMSKVDAVVFMPGWEKARGCQIEHEIAVKYNKFIKEVEDK